MAEEKKYGAAAVIESLRERNKEALPMSIAISEIAGYVKMREPDWAISALNRTEKDLADMLALVREAKAWVVAGMPDHVDA